MSDETVVEADGVRVTKSFDPENFPVPAVRFDVTSTRDDETTLTITDEIPEEFGIEQIGFHPEYGSEHWTATGDGVVRFERTVTPDEEFTTVYGVRMDEDEEPTAFLDTPTVMVGDEGAPTDIDEVVPPESSEVVRELAGGERETVPGLEADAEEGETEAAEPVIDALHEDDAEIIGESETLSEAGEESAEQSVADVAGAAETPPAETEAVQETGEPEPEAEPESVPRETDASPAHVEDLAAALADEIRDGNVDSDDLAVLRDELAPRRTDVQLDHLQSRVSEMEAYADALGEFIDEHGDATGLLESLEDDVAAVNDELQRVEDALDDAAADREAIRDSLDAIESRLDAIDDVEERVDRLAGDVNALDERLEGVEDAALQVEDVESEVSDLQQEVRDLKEWREQLSEMFGG